MSTTEGHREAAAGRRLGPPDRTGFATCLARELARNRRVDLHVALGLLARGCPPKLAVRAAIAPEQGRKAA